VGWSKWGPLNVNTPKNVLDLRRIHTLAQRNWIKVTVDYSKNSRGLKVSETQCQDATKELNLTQRIIYSLPSFSFCMGEL
jgi:hypothetical protein